MSGNRTEWGKEQRGNGQQGAKGSCDRRGLLLTHGALPRNALLYTLHLAFSMWDEIQRSELPLRLANRGEGGGLPYNANFVAGSKL